MLAHIQATDICEHCGSEFANHNYVPNSIDVYECPHEIITSQGYGLGYDRSRPDCYSPDHECCTPAELDNYRTALAEFNRCQANCIPFVCPPGRWGIGAYWYCHQTTFKLWLPPDPDQMELDFE